MLCRTEELKRIDEALTPSGVKSDCGDKQIIILRE
jgi:hypothetical protein